MNIFLIGTCRVSCSIPKGGRGRTLTDHTEGHSPARNVGTRLGRGKKLTLIVLNTKVGIYVLQQLASFTLINLPEIQSLLTNKKGKNII